MFILLSFASADKFRRSKTFSFMEKLAIYHSIAKADLKPSLEILYNDLFGKFHIVYGKNLESEYEKFVRIVPVKEERVNICRRLFNRYSRLLLSLLPNTKNMILKEEEVQRRMNDILTNDCFDKAEHCYPALFEKVA
ncbi:hypothetical protein H311_00042, partial [Anncaliia algerae PRA109]